MGRSAAEGCGQDDPGLHLAPAQGPGPCNALVTRPPGYLLHVDDEQFDLRRFERLAAQGRQALSSGDLATARRLLREALALWRGAPLSDFVYEPFAQAEAARLKELRVATVEDRIEADLRAGQAAELVSELQALAARSLCASGCAAS